MVRETCSNCDKPKKRCICQFLSTIDNIQTVIILQHKKETRHPFSTLPIVANTLARCHVFVGEDFTQTESLQKLLGRLRVWIIFPSAESQDFAEKMESIAEHDKPNALLYVDGTWKKAKKIWYINSFLHDLPQFKLSLQQSSQYQIRRSRYEDSLSLVEAVYESMSILEPSVSFQPLVYAFDNMVKQQLSLESDHKNQK
ncbi:MAG: tRNA-uridine aminocarboxypropyltransferase [Pseudomonadota bacterium]